jgi:hypothetical protein
MAARKVVTLESEGSNPSESASRIQQKTLNEDTCAGKTILNPSRVTQWQSGVLLTPKS